MALYSDENILTRHSDSSSSSMNHRDIRSLVCNTKLLSNVETPICDTLLACGHLVHAKAGAYLLNQGEMADTGYVLLKGEIRLLLLTPDGKRVIIDIIGPGQHLGFFVALTQKPYPISAEVIRASELFAWDAVTMRNTLDNSPKLALTILSSLTDRVICLQSRVQKLATEHIEQRVAYSVLSLAKTLGKENDEGILINVPITHRDLAEMSGTNIYSISRILGRWQQDKIILTGRRRLVICRPDKLQMLSFENS